MLAHWVLAFRSCPWHLPETSGSDLFLGLLENLGSMVQVAAKWVNRIRQKFYGSKTLKYRY